MNSDGDDRPNTHHWPPILYLATLSAAWLLTRWLPLPAWNGSGIVWWLGAGLMSAGLAIAVAALLHFRSIGTTFDPTRPARALATGGIYRFTRNPMYLGVVLVFLGLGVALAVPWLILLLPVMMVALRRLAIDREEAYLERRFGSEYKNYTQRVRRWI